MILIFFKINLQLKKKNSNTIDTTLLIKIKNVKLWLHAVEAPTKHRSYTKINVLNVVVSAFNLNYTCPVYSRLLV